MATLCRVALLLLAASVPAAAQSSPCAVAGTVIDQAGAALPGVTIAVEGSRTSAVTGERGEFCITTLPASRPTVLVLTMDGFRTVRQALPAAAAAPLQFSLTPAFAEALVVTGTRTGRRLDDVPVRTELIDRQAMDRISARTLADAMEFTTGVRVESNCANCNFSQIRLLGLEGPYTQILIDGQPTVSSLAQVYGIEQLPARMIERIEVVKGGGSALYGPGSVGGVVNVISREPSRRGGVVETRSELVRGVPSYSVNGAADWVDEARLTSLTAFVQNDRVKPVDLTGDGFTEVTRRNLAASGVRFARYVLASRAKVTLDATRITEHRRGGNLLRLAPHEADIAESIDSARTAASGSWLHAVSPRYRSRQWRVSTRTGVARPASRSDARSAATRRGVTSPEP